MCTLTEVTKLRLNIKNGNIFFRGGFLKAVLDYYCFFLAT